MEPEVGKVSDVSFVSALLKETQKYVGQNEQEFDFLFPGKGAKSDVLFNAIGVFTSKGIEDTTVQDLLEAANVSRRTFYKYFKNKVDVLESIYQMAAHLLVLKFKTAQQHSSSTNDFTVRCIELYFDFHVLLGPLVRMMTEEARRVESPLASHRDTLLEHIVALFDEKYFEEEAKHLNPKVFYGLIWMMESASMNILAQLPCDPHTVEEYKQTMCAICARVMVTDPNQWSDIPQLPVQNQPA